MLFSYPLMVAIQQISAQVGRTTGKGIAGSIRQHYPGWLLHGIVGLLLIANTINIGADLGAMGDALALLVEGPHLLYVILFAALCAILQVFMDYARYASVLKRLTLALFAYFGEGSLSRRCPGMLPSGQRLLPFWVPRSAPISSSGKPRSRRRTSVQSSSASR
jgi:Mn2+/Fe2+ NRAMP family transporter